MAASVNRHWVLVKRPTAEITNEHLELREGPVPTPKDGEVLVKNKYISIDPTHRIWMSSHDQYMEPVAIGNTMRGISIGEVVESKSDAFKPGDFVGGMGGMQDYFVAPAQALNKIDAAFPLSTYHSVLSVVIGLTAYVGIHEICQVREGDVVVISGAAGAVGSLAGQLAKEYGAKKVIGIVGSADKAEWLTKEAGFTHAINYKTDNVLAKLKEIAPEGLNAYFDNVGGSITEDVFRCFNNFSRVAICGMISGYNQAGGDMAINNAQMILHRRLKVQGFICMDHMNVYPDCVAKLGSMLKEGKLKYKEDIQKGLENYITVVNRLFTGANTGKLMIEV